MSRRDGAIVAWHEVPGKAPPQESRPVGYGVIPADVGGVQECRYLCFGRRMLAILGAGKSHSAIERRSASGSDGEGCDLIL
jgi:hypothetical protein